MTEVIKKNGTKEPFSAEKIRKSITGAARQADISEERKNKVAEQVAATVIPMFEGKEEVKANEIRDIILSELDKIEPAVANSWREYEQNRRKAE